MDCAEGVDVLSEGVGVEVVVAVGAAVVVEALCTISVSHGLERGYGRG